MLFVGETYCSNDESSHENDQYFFMGYQKSKHIRFTFTDNDNEKLIY